jgi:hypothetical protein
MGFEMRWQIGPAAYCVGTENARSPRASGAIGSNVAERGLIARKSCHGFRISPSTFRQRAHRDVFVVARDGDV